MMGPRTFARANHTRKLPGAVVQGWSVDPWWGRESPADILLQWGMVWQFGMKCWWDRLWMSRPTRSGKLRNFRIWTSGDRRIRTSIPGKPAPGRNLTPATPLEPGLIEFWDWVEPGIEDRFVVEQLRPGWCLIAGLTRIFGKSDPTPRLVCHKFCKNVRA